MQKRSKTAIPTDPQCTALELPGGVARCKLHGCYLRKETVGYNGKEIEVWKCPDSQQVIDFPLPKSRLR